MLSTSDAGVVRRDPHLPGLSTLLDGEMMTQRLRRLIPATSDLQASPTYVRYKPGTSCLVAYEVRQDGRTEDFYAKAYTVGSLKLLKGAAGAEAASGSRCTTHIWEDIAARLSGPASDRQLKGLARLCDPQRRHKLLRTILPEQPEFWDARIRRIRYKPERRYVAHLITPHGAGAALKVYSAADFDHAHLVAGLAAAQQISPEAALLAGSAKHRVLLFRWVIGQTLLELLLAGSLDAATIDRLGARLEQLHFHTLPDRRLPRLTPPVMTERLKAAAQSVSAVCPSLADLAELLVRRISAQLRLVDTPARHGMIHGDFKPDQVICGNGEITLLDFDQAGQGDYAADLGAFAAQLERGALLGTWSMMEAEQVMMRLIRSYSHRHDATLDQRVRLYTASGLLLLAPHEFRNRMPNWFESTSRILDRSARLITDAS